MRRQSTTENEFRMGAEKGTFFLSPNGDEEVSDFMMIGDIRAAIDKLNELGDSQRMRADAISNGKAILRNWQPPTADQIDKIVRNMKKQLLS